MQAVIICGGKGTRLKTLIGNKPKALVKFNNKENLKILIEILIAQLWIYLICTVFKTSC